MKSLLPTLVFTCLCMCQVHATHAFEMLLLIVIQMDGLIVIEINITTNVVVAKFFHQ